MKLVEGFLQGSEEKMGCDEHPGHCHTALVDLSAAAAVPCWLQAVMYWASPCREECEVSGWLPVIG